MNFQEELCAWYKIHHRDLPFRQSRDPYAIWVSEIMAQQTRIDAMLPYYKRWMERWPTVEALAEAPIEDVLRGWQGLGYYNRARKLHAGAKVVVERYGGLLPADVEQLRTIPGIGFYTAGAIGSIAYGLRAPAVDGNVLRVTTRVLQYGEDITKKTTADYVWRQVYDWMEGSDPAVFTQAMMEIGALVCTPKNPQCLLCPLAPFCGAGQDGSWSQYPVKKKPKPPLELQLYTYWIENDRRQILLSDDWSDGLMEGLYRLPQAAAPLEQTDQLEYAGQRKHVFSHRVWKMECYRGQWDDQVQEMLPEHCFWIAKDQLDTLPIVGAHRKWLDEGLAGEAEASPDNPESIQISEASLTDPAETAGIGACQDSDASIMEKKKNKKKG